VKPHVDYKLTSSFLFHTIAYANSSLRTKGATFILSASVISILFETSKEVKYAALLGPNDLLQLEDLWRYVPIIVDSTLDSSSA